MPVSYFLDEDQDACNYRYHATVSDSSSNVLDHEPSPLLESSIDIDSFSQSSSSILASSSQLPLYSDSQQTQQQQQQRSTVEKTREELMSEIEQTIDQVMTSIMLGEVIKLPISMRRTTPTSSNQQQQWKKSSATATTTSSENTSSTLTTFAVPSSQQTNKQQQRSPVQQSRIISLSCASSAKTLARYMSILQMIYEAIAYKIMVTKRDMFYRDVSLFGTQGTVDMIVDDLSCHYNVPRSSLNVSAASKGLIFGPIIIKLKNNKVIDCMGGSIDTSTKDDVDGCSDEQGSLIPPVNQIVEVQCKAKCMLVVEKEATFRYLVSVGFCQSLPQSCALVTGKGYPDLSTRQFVKYFSLHFNRKPILALMDNDPHGLDIYATYKWGARAMAFDVLNLAVNNIELLGLTCPDREKYCLAAECYIPMTDRDRSKCLSMIRTYHHDEVPGQSQLVERGYYNLDEQLTSQGHQEYIKEVNNLLRSDYKCELQSLNHAGPFGLTEYLLSKLRELRIM